jgi:hypothetical protein
MTRFSLPRQYDGILIFTVALLARLLWAVFSGLGPEAGTDFRRYDTLSDNILSGDLNLETKLFIVAPLFPYTLALAKLVFGSNWFTGLALIQILISSASTVYLSKAAALVHHKRAMAITAGMLYALSLPTIYYTHLPSQESLFQSLFVISFYWLCQYSSAPTSAALARFSIAFTLALLTKSHVILMIPLLLAFILVKRKATIKALGDAGILLTIIGLLTMPYGLYNLRANGTYVISSSGSGVFFLTGHNEEFYQWLVNTPPKGSFEFDRLNSMNFSAYEEGISAGLTHRQRQSIYLKRGLDWVLKNPVKSANLIVYNIWHHLRPGYSLRFQSLRNWAAAMLFNAPIYTLAYIEMIKGLRRPAAHIPAYIVFASMLVFVAIFYAQNRFRLITIEPIYILYASPGIVAIVHWIQDAWSTHRSKSAV